MPEPGNNGHADAQAVRFDDVGEKEKEEIRELRARRGIATPPGHHFGLAFSGGGIRSATFNLGVLQGLARNGLLRRIDYLSTVSGGGYIGSWLLAWIARAGVNQVETGLRSDKPDNKTARPIYWLREYSNYLTPRMGAFGADTWAAISTYIRNLLLNLLILIGALTAAMLIPRLAFPLFELSATCWAIWAGMIPLAVAVVLLGFHLSTVEDPRDHRLASGQFWVQMTVVWPSLLAVWFATAWLWWLMKPDANHIGTGSLPWVSWALGTAVFHAALWMVAECAGYAATRWRARTAHADTAGATHPLVTKPLWYTASRVGACGFSSGFVGGLLLSIVAHALDRYPPARFPLPRSILVWAPPAVLAAFTITVILHIGLMGRAFSDARREWWSRLGGWLLIYNGVWIALFALTVYGPLIGQPMEWIGFKIRSGLTIGWIASTLAGLLAGRSASTNGRSGSRWLGVAATIGPYIFIVGLGILLSWAIETSEGVRAQWLSGCLATALTGVGLGPATAADIVTLLVCAAVAGLLSWRVDINEFSMHALYRNRLIRCYLGASAEERAPNAFTGFALDDDLPLWSFTATRKRTPDSLREKYDGPYPLINTALNLSAGDELAWQERKASSMVLAPRYCGFRPARRKNQEQPDPAFRPGDTYAAGDDGEHAVSIGTALAISGAAASPNMGYHSSPPLAFLMTVFNVRLGWWLGNPRIESHWKKPGPRMGFIHLLNELFGYSTDTSGYIYLSDGGHFDNLGIYELARRGCRYIVACDASADGNLVFEDLGGAIRKCRTDLGADIDLDVEQIRTAPSGGYSKWHCAVGAIRYANGENGTIVYLKTSLTGDEPSDVRNYAAVNPAFPHQSTVDQFFDESQFESYRALGEHVVTEVFASAVSEARRDHGLPDMEDLFVRLRQRWYPPSAGDPAAFTRHTKTLDEITNRIREDKHLHFLDAQMFPEWKALTTQAGVPQQLNLWLPKTFEELRSGFYVCMEMIQLMENVFLDLDLDTNRDHPQNAGWMNLFKHWSWCGMLRATWAVAGSTYGARFQGFCVHRLGMEEGRSLSITRTMAPSDQDLNFVERELWAKITKQVEVWEPIKRKIEKWRQVESRIDPSGKLKEQLEKWEKANKQMVSNDSWTPTCWVVAASISDPADRRHTLTFNVGFAVTLGTTLIYLRIQDHLRRRSLGRDSLRKLVARKVVHEAAIDLLNSWSLSEAERRAIRQEEQQLGVSEDQGEQVPLGITRDMRLEITDEDRSRVERLFDSVRTSEEN